MIHTTLTRTVLLIAISISPLCALGAEASAQWQDNTALVSQQGDQTVVKSAKDGKVLSRNKNAAAAIESAMASAKNTIVQAGNYVISDMIDVPRAGVTLVVNEGAVITLSGKCKLAAELGVEKKGEKNLIGLVYNKFPGFRCLLFGSLLFPETAKEPLPYQAYTVVYDGRKGASGTLVVTGTISRGFLLLRAKVQVPLICPKSTRKIDPMICMEGVGIHYGMVASLAHTKGGETGKVIEATSGCAVTVDQIIGERSHGMIVSGASGGKILSLVGVGQPRRLITHVIRGNPQWGSGGRARRTDIWKAFIMNDDTVSDVKRTITLSKIPADLPKINVTAKIEVSLKNGTRETFSRQVGLKL